MDTQFNPSKLSNHYSKVRSTGNQKQHKFVFSEKNYHAFIGKNCDNELNTKDNIVLILLFISLVILIWPQVSFWSMWKNFTLFIHSEIDNIHAFFHLDLDSL